MFRVVAVLQRLIDACAAAAYEVHDYLNVLAVKLAAEHFRMASHGVHLRPRALGIAQELDWQRVAATGMSAVLASVRAAAATEAPGKVSSNVTFWRSPDQLRR